MLPLRFLRPWSLMAEEYFRWWRAPGLSEKQANFQFRATYDAAAVRRVLSEGLRLAVLDGIDLVPANVCAAGGLSVKRAPLPATGSTYCLVRLEVNPTSRAGRRCAPRRA